MHRSHEFSRTLWKYHAASRRSDENLMVLSKLIVDRAILYGCHKEAIEVTLNFSCGPTELPSSSVSPLSPPALRVVRLWPWEGLAQSAVRLSHWRGVEGKR